MNTSPFFKNVFTTDHVLETMRGHEGDPFKYLVALSSLGSLQWTALEWNGREAERRSFGVVCQSVAAQMIP